MFDSCLYLFWLAGVGPPAVWSPELMLGLISRAGLEEKLLSIYLIGGILGSFAEVCIVSVSRGNRLSFKGVRGPEF